VEGGGGGGGGVAISDSSDCYIAAVTPKVTKENTLFMLMYQVSGIYLSAVAPSLPDYQCTGRVPKTRRHIKVHNVLLWSVVRSCFSICFCWEYIPQLVRCSSLFEICWEHILDECICKRINSQPDRDHEWDGDSENDI
jgi:hypothetical protein